LVFVKPFEDQADTEFIFTAKGDQTVVTWTMTGERPFIGKVMDAVFNMDRMVGGQFEKGLAKLKAIVEKA
jgi:hypothetical protein